MNHAIYSTRLHQTQLAEEVDFHKLWRRTCYEFGCWLTLPDDLMPLMSAAVTSKELSSRQRARCQTTGPVSSRPLDLCRATRLRRRDIWLYSHSMTTSVCICARLHECVILTSSTAHSGSALELWSCRMKDKCFFSWVQLATSTPLTLQYTRKGERTSEWHSQEWHISIQQTADLFNTSSQVKVMSGKAPVGVLLQLLSAQLKQLDHGRGDWKEANM